MQDKQISLLIPDKAVIVFIIQLDAASSKKELDRLIQWKLRKSIPFPIDAANVSWMPISLDKINKKINILVTLIKKDILEQYEKIARSIDASVNLVDTPFFNLLNYLMMFCAQENYQQQDFLLINFNGSYITTGLFAHGELSLYKCRSLMQSPDRDVNEYKKEIIKELHPLVMFYFDQLGGKNLQHVFLKEGNNAIEGLLKDKYGFDVVKIPLLRKVVLENNIRLSQEDINVHLPLIGTLIGRRPI